MDRFYSIVLVITDQYPPQVTGGAEISLHAQLKSTTHHNARVVIATLDSGITTIKRGFYDGIEVVRLPFNEEWPKFVSQPTRLQRYKTAVKEFFEHRRLKDETFIDKARLITSFYRSNRRGLGLLPMLDQQTLVQNPVVEQLQHLVDELDPDLIHADNYRSIVLAAALNLTVPVISSVRDNRFFCAHRNQANNIRGKICTECEFGCVEGGREAPEIVDKIKLIMREVMDVRHAALKSSAEIVVTSRFLEAQIRSLIPDAKITRIPNITENPEVVDALTSNFSPASPPEILCVGMIGHNKGQLGIVNNLEVLEEYATDFRVVFAGRGALTSRLEKIVGEKGLRDRVHFTGFLSRSELFRSYARATVVICPNVWPEPFGRVPLEAGLAGKPVVVLDTGGIAEQIVDGKTGIVVPANEPELLLRRVGELLNDPLRARHMGAAARQYVESRHTSLKPGLALSELWSSYFRTND